jgi:hypothetical protein
MGKLRPRVRRPALPGMPRTKVDVATAQSVRDAKEQARRGANRVGPRTRTRRRKG